MLNSICHISRYLSKDFMETLPITPGNKFYWDSIQFPENIFSVCWDFKLCTKCNRKFVAGVHYLCCSTALTHLTCLHFLVLSIQGKKMSCFWVQGKTFLFYNSLCCLFFLMQKVSSSCLTQQYLNQPRYLLVFHSCSNYLFIY